MLNASTLGVLCETCPMFRPEKRATFVYGERGEDAAPIQRDGRDGGCTRSASIKQAMIVDDARMQESK